MSAWWRVVAGTAIVDDQNRLIANCYPPQNVTSKCTEEEAVTNAYLIARLHNEYGDALRTRMRKEEEEV